MTPEEARARLSRMTAATEEPVLSVEELDDLLAETVMPEGGWHFRRAAAEGWLWKAGKVANRYAFTSPDGSRYERDALFRHCVDMAALYQRGAGGTIELVGPPPWDPVIGNVNGGN